MIKHERMYLRNTQCHRRFKDRPVDHNTLEWIRNVKKVIFWESEEGESRDRDQHRTVHMILPLQRTFNVAELSNWSQQIQYLKYYCNKENANRSKTVIFALTS